MQVAFLPAAFVAASIVSARAMPYSNTPTKTSTDYDCVTFTYDPQTKTVTVAGHTVTVTASTVDQQAAPEGSAKNAVIKCAENTYASTVVETKVCASTRTRAHFTTVTDPAYTQTVTV
ncbi:hypothetical protein HDZ31DRAFT_62995 [Schizophyllum fasciatum]